MAKGSTIAIIAAGTAALSVLLVLLTAPVATNLWLLAIERAYVIPVESSIFSFTPTVMNSGSGDWWIYGEDRENFYYFTGESPSFYVYYPKRRVAQCAGFQPRDYSSWCLEKRGK